MIHLCETLTETIRNNGSTFLGMVAKFSSAVEVKRAYIKVRQTFPADDHEVGSFCFKMQIGYIDGGAYGAGKRITEVPSNEQTAVYTVFIICTFGGVHLGPKRFYIMEHLTKDLMVKMK